ncbi:hypothetical protein [Streptomyces sp. NPDC094472]|uniref:hypothetical protein n=1 Tax=Streptomyces sp. NPDC094472 TaxID=3155080 RepID=UPI003329E4B2
MAPDGTGASGARPGKSSTDPEVHGSPLHGYDLEGRDMTRFSPSYDGTAGAMISTVDDLARFERAPATLLRSGPPGRTGP